MRKIGRNKNKEAGLEEEVNKVESESEMPQNTSHLDWHVKAKRKEDIAWWVQTQSRNWFLEKVDWIKNEAIEDMTEEGLIAEEKIVICKVVKTDENMVISPKVRRVSTLEDKRMLKAGNREGPCPTLGRGPNPTLGRGPSPTAPPTSVSPVPVSSSLSASFSPRTRSTREATKPKSPYPSNVNLRSPSSPPHEEISQDVVGLRKDDSLNNLIALFPLPAAANPPSTPGANYNTKEGPSSLQPPSPAPIPPASLAAPPTPVGDVNALLDSPLVFGLVTRGTHSGSSGGIPGLSIPGISLTVSAPEVQTTMSQAVAELKPPPELKPPVTQYTPKVGLPSLLIRPLRLSSHHPSLKERQGGIIDLLYGADNLQCKYCGVRFSKEEMPKYTSHLDWHFR